MLGPRWTVVTRATGRAKLCAKERGGRSCLLQAPFRHLVLVEPQVVPDLVEERGLDLFHQSLPAGDRPLQIPLEEMDRVRKAAARHVEPEERGRERWLPREERGRRDFLDDDRQVLELLPE